MHVGSGDVLSKTMEKGREGGERILEGIGIFERHDPMELEISRTEARRSLYETLAQKNCYEFYYESRLIECS